MPRIDWSHPRLSDCPERRYVRSECNKLYFSFYLRPPNMAVVYSLKRVYTTFSPLSLSLPRTNAFLSSSLLIDSPVLWRSSRQMSSSPRDETADNKPEDELDEFNRTAGAQREYCAPIIPTAPMAPIRRDNRLFLQFTPFSCPHRFRTRTCRFSSSQAWTRTTQRQQK